MEIDVFGKQDCGKCETAKSRLKDLLLEKTLTDKIPLRYFDMETVDGMAEGAFNDVLNIPTIIIRNENKKIARWDGNVPETSEMESYLQQELG